MQTVKVSIIIPCFNAENTVDKCILKALSQTVKEKEIICIDDGSEDRTVEIIEEFAKSYSQIRIFSQKHMGAGKARNRGIKEACGKYVAFLDADDYYWNENALEEMIQAADEFQQNICGSYRKTCLHGVISDSNLLREFDIQKRGTIISFSDYQNDYDYQSFIFNRAFLVEHQIYFPAYMRYQDPPFMIKAMINAKTFAAVPVILYLYNAGMVKNSVLNRYVCDILDGILDSLKMAQKNCFDDLYEKIINRIEEQYHETILNSLSDECFRRLLEINKRSIEVRGYPLQIVEEIYNSGAKIENLARSHEMQKKIIMIKESRVGFISYFKKYGIKNVVVYGIGAYGKILVEELWSIGINVICGIDKNVLYYKNLPVRTPNDPIPKCDLLIVSLMESECLVTELRKRTETPVVSFSEILDETYDEINRLEKFEVKPYLEYMVLNILDHCNLRCKGCDHFACIAEPYFVSLDSIRRDLKRMSELFNGKNIMQIAVMGGEPLLHPELTEILMEVRNNFPETIIRLTTNGLLLLKQTDEFWKVCREQRIIIVNTKYPINLDYEKIIEKAKREQVSFRYFEGTGDEVVKKSFKKVINLVGDSEMNESFMSCHISNYGNFLMEGKLYGCPFSCQSYRIFNKKYGTSLELLDEDYLDIYSIDSQDEIFEFAAKPRHYCRYCKGISKEFAWSRSKQKICEWIEE